MADSTPSALSAKAQTQVSREEVKQLALNVGLREAARQLGLKESRVLQWSKRGNWFKPIPQPPRQADVITVIKPSDALANVLNDRKQQTKLHLSKYAVEASEQAANHSDKLKITGEAKDLASVSSHLWPEEKAEGSGVMGGLRVYSQQTVLNVQTQGYPEPQAP